MIDILEMDKWTIYLKIKMKFLSSKDSNEIPWPVPKVITKK